MQETATTGNRNKLEELEYRNIHEGGLDKMSFKVPPTPNQSGILCD